jgi:hypothetical protein
MPQHQRMYCTNCGESVYNKTIDGERVPLVIYMVVGQPPDTGPAVDLDVGSPVKVPSFVREIMQTPVARVEFCVPCFAAIFGLTLVTADDDPMYSSAQAAENTASYNAVQLDDSIPAVEKSQQIHARTLTAIQVGRGAKKAPKLLKDPTVKKSLARAKARA